jgi:two-component system OmpR family sensor kinase
MAPDHRWLLELGTEPVDVIGDAGRLHQVVANLLTNARLHTPAGTTVTVSQHPDGFAVHDDGPGFDPSVAERAFDRFVRGAESRTRASGTDGTGLGLSVVHAITEAHGGQVQLESEPGNTTIRVTLPRDVSDAGPTGPPRADEPRPSDAR